jgi:hypothetical protein
MTIQTQTDGFDITDDAQPTMDQPIYYFGLGVGPNHTPSLEAVKIWRVGDERRFDTFTIAEYGTHEEAAQDEKELAQMQSLWGVQSAMNLAENMASANGYLDPQRKDGRVFFAVDAPADTFTTVRERGLAHERQWRETPDYHVYNVLSYEKSSVWVKKQWGKNEQTFLDIPQIDWEAAEFNYETTRAMIENGDFQNGLTFVELLAIEAGVLQADRDDPRLFSEGPPDPYMSIRERQLRAADLDTEPLIPTSANNKDMYAAWARAIRRDQKAHQALQGSAWFEATFEKHPVDLLQPIDDTVNYAVVVRDTDPWTRELMIEKYWRERQGYLGVDTFTVDSYASDNEEERLAADAARKELLQIYQERGLEPMMRQAELDAMKKGYMSSDRVRPYLFDQKATDRFVTLAQQLDIENNPYWSIGDDVVDTDIETTVEPSTPTVEQKVWEELLLQHGLDKPNEDRHYWQMHYRRAETSTGEPLGGALFVTEFPQLPPDFDDYVEQWGLDDSIYPTQARTLELAHFVSDKDAAKFEKEFRSYLQPGVIDAIELAPEVAKLEGLSGVWREMDYNEIVDYMSDLGGIVRDLNQWHPHNPHAERDLRMHLESGNMDIPSMPMITDADDRAASLPDLDL